MKTFVSTLLTVTHAQRRLHVDRLAAAVDGEVGGDGGGEEPSAQESSPDDGEPSATAATAAKVDPLCPHFLVCLKYCPHFLVCLKYKPTSDKDDPLWAHTFWSALSTNQQQTRSNSSVHTFWCGSCTDSSHAGSAHGLCLFSGQGPNLLVLKLCKAQCNCRCFECLLFLRDFVSVFCHHQEPSPADGKAKEAGEAPRGASPSQPGKAAPVKGSVSCCNQEPTEHRQRVTIIDKSVVSTVYNALLRS